MHTVVIGYRHYTRTSVRTVSQIINTYINQRIYNRRRRVCVLATTSDVRGPIIRVNVGRRCCTEREGKNFDSRCVKIGTKIAKLVYACGRYTYVYNARVRVHERTTIRDRFGKAFFKKY